MTITLGELIEKLKQCRPDNEVSFDFGYLVPTTLDSWRGVYADLALGYEVFVYRGDRPQTTQELIEKCEQALQNSYEGYKGGTYFMDEESKVWVDNWGQCTHTEIVDVVSNNWKTMLITRSSDLDD